MTVEVEDKGASAPPVDPSIYGIPVCGLKESIHSLGVLYKGATGEICPKCGGKEFNKLGTYSYKGKRYPKKLCRDCGYSFSIVDLQNDGSTHNRAARIFNLNNKKADTILEDALQFGILKEVGNDKYKVNPLPALKSKIYHNVPLYHYLIETVGYNLKRYVFETALKSYPDGSLAKISKIKRDTLWRRYQEIAVEIFICEKTCKFSRICKTPPQERAECSIVKKDKIKKRWKAEIEI